MKETKIYSGEFNVYLKIRKRTNNNYSGLLEIVHNTFMALNAKYFGTIWITTANGWLNRRFNNFYEYIIKKKIMNDVHTWINTPKISLDNLDIISRNYNMLRIMNGFA